MTFGIGFPQTIAAQRANRSIKEFGLVNPIAGISVAPKPVTLTSANTTSKIALYGRK